MLICLTDRKLCKDNFLQRINLLAQGKPQAIILREKDMSMPEYEHLAIRVQEICRKHQVSLIVHQNVGIATKLNIDKIHLSMPNLRIYQHLLDHFSHVGASVHSVQEAREAQIIGASYLIAGHIYSTDSKKGVPPRGISFLKELCASVTIPIYAIGGITADKVPYLLNAGAKGICVMSEAMTCTNPRFLIKNFLANIASFID